MRNAPTVRIFAVLIGFVLALPAAAETQNSSTLKTEPVSSVNVTSSCSSATTLAGSTSPALGGTSAGLSTPRDADPFAIFQEAARASGIPKICVVGGAECAGKEVRSTCGVKGRCVASSELEGGYACFCDEPGGGNGGDPPGHCRERGRPC